MIGSGGAISYDVHWLPVVLVPLTYRDAARQQRAMVVVLAPVMALVATRGEIPRIILALELPLPCIRCLLQWYYTRSVYLFHNMCWICAGVWWPIINKRWIHFVTVPVGFAGFRSVVCSSACTTNVCPTCHVQPLFRLRKRRTGTNSRYCIDKSAWTTLNIREDGVGVEVFHSKKSNLKLVSQQHVSSGVDGSCITFL